MSDSFDDDDDIFSDPAALTAIAAIEERAIAASQAPKRGTSLHHRVTAPASRGRRAAVPAVAAVAPRKAPPPLNTNPRVTGCGFGWETGGKHQVRAEQAASRNATASASVAPPPRAPQQQTDDDYPMDAVVVNDKGQYGFGSNDDDPIIDQRKRPEIRQLAESAPLRAGERPPLPGSQARREAIAAATASNAPALGMRGPIQRSTSSTSTGGIPTDAPSLGNSRSLARSISTGAQVFGGRPPAAGSSRVSILPPIPSQGSNPPSSQGAVARRAVMELDEQKRLREAADNKVRALQSRVALLERGGARSPWRDEVQAGDNDWETKYGQIQQELWATQGKASTAKRNWDTNEAALRDQIEKLRSKLQDVESQTRARELEAKQRVESMKTQAVFSNHNAIASASKARQWSGSQRAGATPMKGGSPLRDKSLMTPAPLMRSAAKGKGRAAPPQRFDHLTNAFNITPTVNSRAKRQRTEVPSPTTTPKKQQQRVVSPVVSPIQSQQSQGRHGSDSGLDEAELDWQPVFEQPAFEDVVMDERDSKLELVHHLLNHVTSSSLQDNMPSSFNLGLASEPTILRIMKAPVLMNDMVADVLDLPVSAWKDACRDLLQVCGDNSRPFDAIAPDLMRTFALMLTIVIEAALADRDTADVTLTPVLIGILRFIGSTLLLFPELVEYNGVAIIEMTQLLREVGSCITGPQALVVQSRWDKKEKETLEADVPANQRPSALCLGELADAVVEVGEAICLADVKCVWTSDQLAYLILAFTKDDDPRTVRRGLDLFVAASCRQDHFRAIIFPPDSFPGEVPVIDRVARFLVNGHPKMEAGQVTTLSLAILGSLFMLSRSDADATVLMTEHSVLVPAILTILHRESTRIWGVRAQDKTKYNPLTILSPAIALLHHLVFPPPLSNNIHDAGQTRAVPVEDKRLFDGPLPQGVDLARRLNEASSTKEFNGLQHVFVTALGSMAYAEYADMDESKWENSSPGTTSLPSDHASDLRAIQFIAQDLLDAVVEGPEGDQVYELYVDDDDHGAANMPPRGGSAVQQAEDVDEEDEERMIGDAEQWEAPQSPVYHYISDD